MNKSEKYGFQTKNVVVRGWPACIFCSAKDESKWDVWPEIKSRFLISSPNMVSQKYKESTKLIAQVKGLPTLIQEQIIVSEKEIELARECILTVKQNIEKLRSNNNKKISLWIPFHGLLQQELPSNRGTDVRFIKRIFSFLNVLPIIRHDQRYSLVLENETSVIAFVEDLKEVLSITQNFDGILKYKKEFFDNIFYPCYKSKTEPDCNSDGLKREEITAVTTKQLCDFYKKAKGKSISTDNLKKVFLNELLNNELIDCESSTIHQRQYIYYPLVEPTLLSNTIIKDNNNDQEGEGKASFSSNLRQFDHLLHIQSPIYEKIIKKIDEAWLFYEIMQLISHRIDLGKIKGPLADFLNNNDKFWMVDNKKTDHNSNPVTKLSLDNNSYSISHTENESSTNKTNEEGDISLPQKIQQECCCCNNIDKSGNFNNNRLTIKQFVKSYTNFSKLEFDVHKSLKWASLTKISQNPSKIAKFDEKDETDTNTNLMTNSEKLIISQTQMSSSHIETNHSSKDKIGDDDNNDEALASPCILDPSNDQVTSLDADNDAIVNNEKDIERLIEDHKLHPLVGYEEPFYFCKEDPQFKSLNSEEILLHIMLNPKDHQPK